MHENKDFQSMTLDELTPIVSMRPGKEYTKEELRAARTAFMEKLGCSNPEIEPEEPEEMEVAAIPADMLEESTEEEVVFAEASVSEAAPILAETPSESVADFSSAMILPKLEETPETTEEPALAEAPEEPKAPEAAEEVPLEEVQEEPEKTVIPSGSEEFILKSDSRLARFLYRLYAYLLLPILALESLSLLLASVGTAVAVSDAPYIFIHVICAAIYTMIITLSWHQFFHRTKFGLLLNRSLIGVCIIRGFLMLISGTDILWGVIFISLSVLFLVYFIGYDSMFIIPSPKRQRAR